jgi:hypothetical protein
MQMATSWIDDRRREVHSPSPVLKLFLPPWILGLLAWLAPGSAWAQPWDLPIRADPAYATNDFPTGTNRFVFNTDPTNGAGRVVWIYTNYSVTNDDDTVSNGFPVVVYDFNSIDIPENVTVEAVGYGPLILASLNNIDLRGTINASGPDGENNMCGGGGGGAGGGSVALISEGTNRIWSTGQILAHGGNGGLGDWTNGTGLGGGATIMAGSSGSGGNGGTNVPGLGGGGGGGGGEGGKGWGRYVGRGGGGGGGAAYGGALGLGGRGKSNGTNGVAGLTGNCNYGAAGGDGGSGGHGDVNRGRRGSARDCGTNAAVDGESANKGQHTEDGGGGGGGAGAVGGRGGNGGAGRANAGAGGGGGGGGAGCNNSSCSIDRGKAGSAGNGAAGSWGAGGGGNGGIGGDGTTRTTSTTQSSGGSGGGGAVALGSSIGEVLVDGSISVLGGTNSTDATSGGDGIVGVFGNVPPDTNGIRGTLIVTNGCAAAEWFINGGGGGGGAGANGTDSALLFRRSGSDLVLTWFWPCANLQSAYSASGPWSPIAGASSPWVVPIQIGSPRFYRLSQ